MRNMPTRRQGRPDKLKDVSGNPLPELPKVAEKALAPAEPAEHEVNHWMQTLMDAHDIQKDPEKMGHVKKHADKKIGKIKSIQDLKDYEQAKYGKGSQGEE